MVAIRGLKNMKIQELKTSEIKKALGFKKASFRYHNKNNSGGNFGTNFIYGEWALKDKSSDYENFDISGEYDATGELYKINIGYAYQGLGVRLSKEQFKDLKTLIENFKIAIAEERKTQEFLRKGNEESQKEREQAEKKTLQATQEKENEQVKGLGCGICRCGYEKLKGLKDSRGIPFKCVCRNNEEEIILSELAGFTGTEKYHKISLGCLMATDGFKFFCDRLKCFWLSDIVSSVQHLNKVRESREFIIWKIKVNPDKSFIVRAYSDLTQDEETNNKLILYEQKGDYTDFKLKEYEFYQEGDIVLLKSEH
jgi:hypothetical protein